MTIDAPKKEQITQLRKLWQEAFGDSDAFLDTFFSTAFSPDRCRCIFIDRQVAAALYWMRCSYMGRPAAYLYAVATAKAHRGKGLCRKLMEDSHAQLARQGYTGSVLVPGEKPLFQMYGSMGYQVFGGITEIRCTPEDEAIPMRRVDAETYARLRREHLPVGGILQEEENLDFLQTQAVFYAGADFLLAARKEEYTLHGLELLGNTHTAAKILYTLGCHTGIFRTPGNTPFAMYRALGEGVLPMPQYFGFAFD